MNKNTYIVGVIVLVVLAGVVYLGFSQGPQGLEREEVASPSSTPPETSSGTPASETSSLNSLTNNMHTITLDTNFGKVKFQTYDADAPKTVENFITLANKGFYNNLTFHRVIKDFMIQGGDPTGNGTGGPGYAFEDELNPATESYKSGYKKGVVAMANAGPNTNGSQFFIMLADYPLPNKYSIFGKVIEGQSVVDAIGLTKTDGNDKPLSPAIIKSAIVEELK
jgi:cyclophilin family peptidyl-prolyl cis-trans isomerase